MNQILLECKLVFIAILALHWIWPAGGHSLNIIGGTPATKGEFPWMVSVQTKFPQTKHVCGGSIINSTFIVTAGHCVHGYSRQDLQIMAGAHNIKQYEWSQQVRDVTIMSIHPNFENTAQTTRNDLALLEVNPPLDFNEFVQPIQLPDVDHIVSGYCWIAGWGQTETATSSDILLKASIPIVSKAQCEAVYNDRLDKDNQLCAGYAAGGVDVCIGDTGGPLMCNDTDAGAYYLAGIGSWGYLCGAPEFPGVYTEVSYYTIKRDEEPQFVISM